MRKDFLFSYMIDCVKVEVCSLDFPEKSSFVNNEFYRGLTEAIAEYLYYPSEIIAPRAQSFKVKFVYDNKKLEDVILVAEEYIAECTKGAFLNYMEESQEHAKAILPEFITTPDLNIEKANAWCEKTRQLSKKMKIHTTVTKSDEQEFEWIEFSYENNAFYGKYYDEGSKYLLVSLPGYNSDWNDVSSYINQGYDVLQLSPLGYNTPNGFNNTKRVRGAWPVLYDTVSETNEDVGYNKWFLEVCLAIETIKKADQELIFIGTSQGGGASLVMSSMFNDCTVACAAEMPFLIGFSSFNYARVRSFVANQINNPYKMIYDFYAKERLYVIDPMVHSERIKCPTLLIAGELDSECFPADIYRLYETLSCKKEYIELKKQGHGYTKEFMKYAKDWISLAVNKG